MKEYDIVSELISQASKKREQYIIDRLRDLGHTFESDKDLAKFAKKRLTLVLYEDVPDKEILFLDGETMLAVFNVYPVYNENTRCMEF